MQFLQRNWWKTKKFTMGFPSLGIMALVNSAQADLQAAKCLKCCRPVQGSSKKNFIWFGPVFAELHAIFCRYFCFFCDENEAKIWKSSLGQRYANICASLEFLHQTTPPLELYLEIFFSELYGIFSKFYSFMKKLHFCWKADIKMFLPWLHY